MLLRISSSEQTDTIALVSIAHMDTGNRVSKNTAQPTAEVRQAPAKSAVASEDERLLKSLGYKTLPAANAAEALTISDSGAPFDLLFTDITMPGRMNGRQLAVEMAKRRSTLKVLFTSGYSEYTAALSDRPDAEFLLAKPYRKSELARMIRLALTPKDASQPGRRQASF